MENQIALMAFRCWDCYLKPFLIAAMLGILAGACFGSLAHAAQGGNTKSLTDNAAVSNQIASAGRIRQQAQRIAKLYQQIGMGLEAERARRQVMQATRQMDTDVSGLMRSTMAEKSQQLMERTRKVWEEMRRDCDLPFTPQNRERIFIHADDLAMLSGRLATNFELGASTAASRLLDLTLRQGMLVQRLARLYLTAYAGDKSTGLHIDIEQARREFSSALNELATAPENSETNRRTLDLARTQWFFFEQSLAGMNNSESSNPKNVATSSERILEVLDELSIQYARAGDATVPARNERNS
ncbi:MAG: type IV pili methyl-accepting chemotaxis transducer N-terminal domain-containing protein [Propionivibrio sp.]